MSMQTLAQKSRDEFSNRYLYTERWDADKIQGCKCDFPATGYDCSRTLCPTGDDPLTLNQNNEVQIIQCIANTGSFVLFYNGVASANIAYDATALSVSQALQKIPALKNGVKVSFSIPNSRVCQLQRNNVLIEFTQQFGKQNPLVPQLSADMSSSGGQVNVRYGGVAATDVRGTISKSVLGSKENDVCAGRGMCDTETGLCHCFATAAGEIYASSNGYGAAGIRGDCGHVLTASQSASSPVSHCPGSGFEGDALACSGHGVCDTNSFRCYCQVGWQGGDCSQQTCPKGLSWFSYPTQNNVAHDSYATCSNMGHCDHTTGRCDCRAGFFGAACQYMSCPSATPNSVCSGHGRCLNMARLARETRLNGVLASDNVETAISYGSDANSAETWDAQRIHGCNCDAGYTGYDCSQRLCPMGDDPGTYEDHSEVQLYRCIANEGNFTLSFRSDETPLLSHNISAAELQQRLARLSTISHISVYFLLDNNVPNNTFADVTLPKKVPGGNFLPEPGAFDPVTHLFNHFEPTQPPIRYNTSFCDPQGDQVAVIVFTHTHGALPAFVFNTSHLVNTLVSQNADAAPGRPGSGEIKSYLNGEVVKSLRSFTGTTENELCNNRGLCDLTSGQCRCLQDWSSSDGARQGGPGPTADCGTRNVFQFTSFNSLYGTSPMP
jgi:hypothetical protein